MEKYVDIIEYIEKQELIKTFGYTVQSFKCSLLDVVNYIVQEDEKVADESEFLLKNRVYKSFANLEHLNNQLFFSLVTNEQLDHINNVLKEFDSELRKYNKDNPLVVNSLENYLENFMLKLNSYKG